MRGCKFTEKGVGWRERGWGQTEATMCTRECKLGKGSARSGAKRYSVGRLEGIGDELAARGCLSHLDQQGRPHFAVYFISQVVLVVKNPPANAGDIRHTG